MARSNGNRRAYNPVASADEAPPEQEQEQPRRGNIITEEERSSVVNMNTNNNSSPPPRTNRRRQPYTRVSSNDEAVAEGDDEEAALSVDSSTSRSSTLKEENVTSENDSTTGLDDSKVVDDEDDDGRRITVKILDFAHSTFTVSVNPSWTVARFKQVSSETHKVPFNLQRLIFQGKLLSDSKTLEESGIDKDCLIVHLFPKPRVVISSEATTDEQQEQNENNEQDSTSSESTVGARVPTIVLDADEAERRSQILVLGSVEFMEAQNNVKLFSFMLLIISSIELLNLLALALGVPQEDPSSVGPGSGGSFPYDNDDFWPSPDNPPATNYSSSSNSTDWGGNGGGQPNVMYIPWGTANSIDTVLSLAGVYVAIMGIQASNENTLRLAKIYLWGTLFVGVGWMLFNYFVTVQVDKTIEEEHRASHPNDDYVEDMSDADLYQAALSVMFLPGMVWLMCCLRAWQFHHLLQEAEEEAHNRIQSELEQSQENAGDEELALQNESATLT